MEYIKLIEKLKKICERHYLVNEALIGDISILDEQDNLNYPLCLINVNNSYLMNNKNGYTFNLTYVDRLSDNKHFIHNNSLRFFKDLITLFNDTDLNMYLDDDSDYLVELYEEKFMDLCAGGFMELVINTPDSYGVTDLGFKQLEEF